MANQTWSADGNYDDSAKTGLVDGDTVNIDTNATLTQNSDSRWGQQAAVPGAVTIATATGGKFKVDATETWWIAFDASTGNVPTLGNYSALRDLTNLNIITRGGVAVGEFLGIYTACGVSPSAAASAMPAAGYIKMRWANTTFADNDVLTLPGGATATVSEAGNRGWLNVVLKDGSTAAGAAITVPRLGTFQTAGDWFYLGQTNGANDQTFQYYVADYCPAIWIETGPSTGIYELWLDCGASRWDTATKTVETGDFRGKWFSCTAAGVIELASTGGTTCGYKPPTGCNVRVPNIHFSGAISGAYAVNVAPNATLSRRPNTVTTSAGQILVDKTTFGDFYMSVTQGYSFNASYCSFYGQILLTEVASNMTVMEIGVAVYASQKFSQGGLYLYTCLAGGTFTKCKFSIFSLTSSGDYGSTVNDATNFTFDTCWFFGFGTTVSSNARGNSTTGSLTASRMTNCTFTSCFFNGGRALLTTCVFCTFTNSIYSDICTGTTTTTNAQYAFDLSTKCQYILIDGMTFGSLWLVQPYSGILQVNTTGCSNITLRNLGTYGSPLSLGAGPYWDCAWSRVTTTATVTKVAHGLKTNDIIYVIISSSTGAITVATKTVASTPTLDTFTFTCTNGGAASGTLSYIVTMSAYLLSLVSASVANNVRIQCCYTPQNRTNLWTSDNSAKNIIMECVHGFTVLAPVSPYLNGYQKGIMCAHAMTAQTSCYGTHWFDVFFREVTPNLAGQSWTRSTTTATVTSNNHGLMTGAIINVTVTSDPTAIPLGQYSITATAQNTFTFTCLDAGAANGTLTFQPFNGRVGLLMNESTTDTSNQYTLDAGSPKFTSAGGLYMPTVNDQITFVSPTTINSYILGHESFPIAEAVMVGGTIGNYDITYAIDKNNGSGYSTFNNLYYPRPGGSGTGGQFTFTVTNATGVAINDYVWGTGIGIFAKVTDINLGTNTITVDVANSGAVSGIIRFNHLPYETGITSLGFKLKVRIKTSTVNATAITSLYAWSFSDATSRAYQYSLETVPINIYVKNSALSPIQDAKVCVEKSSDYTQLMNIITDVNGLATTTVAYLTDISAIVRIRKSSPGQTRYVPYETYGQITSSGYSLTAILTEDPIAV